MSGFGSRGAPALKSPARMTGSLRHLQDLLAAKENEHLEFKEAKANFHFEKLVKYCAALANEGGGSIILGVTDKRPRRVVGSQAFADLERTKAGLIGKLHLRIEVGEIAHPDGRVLVFTAPPRPIGAPIPVDGAYWMRAGEDLAPMTPDMLRRIFDETAPDFSAEICPEATLADLDPAAIESLRNRWLSHSGNRVLARKPTNKLLQDAELIMSGGVTYAALILLGTRAALGRLLAQAEVIFEYRATASPGPANQREEFRQGFLLFYDRVWELVDLAFQDERPRDFAAKKLLAFLHEHAAQGKPMEALLTVTPELSRTTIKRTLSELRERGKTHSFGKGSQTRWFPGPPPKGLDQIVTESPPGRTKETRTKKTHHENSQ